MSDADDGFDREAERRKLEEKYGDDAERRESTQRMSELLLKGATMTNKHCDNCGDPLFRQNGQVFCPSCSANAEANGETGQAQNADTAEADSAQADTARGDSAQPDATRPDTAQADSQTTETAQRHDESDTDAEQPTPPETGRRPTERQPTDRGQQTGGRQPRTDAGQQPRRQTAGRQSTDTGRNPRTDTGRQSTDTGQPTAQRPTESVQSSGDLAAARESLVAAISEQARRGAAADDPRTAADHFAAAREAAETLAALRR